MNRLVVLLSGLALFVTCQLPVGEAAPHFIILGAHTDLACADCHPGGVFDQAPATCAGCHQDDAPVEHYEGDCGACHSEEGWELAVVDHSFLSIDGGHADLLCSDCHDPDDLTTLTGATCATCHEAPANHLEGPCEDCHVVASWSQVTFDHDDYFPVPHRGVSECVSCHPAGHDSFTCIDCHEHRKSKMDDEHKGISKYEWDSEACLDCHPRGRH